LPWWVPVDPPPPVSGFGWEAQLARGDFRDPRLGDIKVGEWHARVTRARGIEEVTKDKNASLWRTHCEPEWAAWPMAAVTRLEAQSWVDRLRSTRRARHQGRAVTDVGEDVPVLSAATIADIVHLMSSVYRLAMREHPPLVTVNPFADLELPKIEPRPVEFYEHEEAAALYEATGGQWRILTELGMDVGLRPGELYGLHGHRVDWLRGKIAVVDVMTRKGLRQWPKSKRSHRVVPIPAHLLEDMSVLMAGRARDSLVFTAPEGGPVTDAHFRNRVWYPAVQAAGSAVSRRGSCGTPPPRGWCRTGCRCTTFRPSSGTRTTPRPSGTPTWPRTRMTRCWSRGRGVLAHVWRTARKRAAPHDGKQPSDLGRGGRI
jgi:integrase